MTLEEIEALRAPEQRPGGVTHLDYTKLCFRAGVADPINKSEWDSLPIFKADAPDYDLKKDEDEDMGSTDAEETGEETETAEADEDDDVQEDEEEASEKAIAVGDLMKAIDAYSIVEDAIGPTSSTSNREAVLQARLDAGTISKSERAEIGRIWAGEDDESHEEVEPMRKSLVEALSEDDNSAHLVDASDFLRTLVKGVDDRMGDVLGEVTRDGRATRELMKAQGSLIKSLAHHASEQDRVIQAMAARLETIEHTPAPRRAVSSRRDQVQPRAMQKSVFAGESDGESMSKSDVTKGLRALLLHAADKGDNSAMSNITHATALYEQTGTLPSNIMDAVRQVS